MLQIDSICCGCIVLPSELKESFLGLWKQSHWNGCWIEPFCFSLWGYFYIWTENMCPWSVMDCLWELLRMSKDACRQGLHKFCSREILCGQKATENSFGCLQGLHQGLCRMHPGQWQTLALQGCTARCSAGHGPYSASAEGKFYGLVKVHWFQNKKKTLLELFSACSNQCIVFHLRSPSLPQALNPWFRDRSNVTMTQRKSHEHYNLFSINLFLRLRSNYDTLYKL